MSTLERLCRLYAEATPGRWEYRGDDADCMPSIFHHDGYIDQRWTVVREYKKDEDDGRLIVELHNAFPRIRLVLRAVERFCGSPESPELGTVESAVRINDLIQAWRKFEEGGE